MIMLFFFFGLFTVFFLGMLVGFTLGKDKALEINEEYIPLLDMWHQHQEKLRMTIYPIFNPYAQKKTNRNTGSEVRPVRVRMAAKVRRPKAVLKVQADGLEQDTNTKKA